ncbi:transporter [Pontibacter diazotrophicus]|uniref:Transporter n=1 Tax=Pontibacter diazotrophicus TaxID=1400979 RepID=A0A3D8LG67_9BACT|nr:transporter [Pontibacter diazotrophicus]RDV15892.1 transporter [Pontibacter diazotrophicus]
MNIKPTIQKAFLLITALLFILVKQGNAQEQEEDLGRISTGRPDQTQGTTVVPKSTLQIESGFLYQKNTAEEQETKTHAYPTVSLRYGLLERLELRVDGAFQDSVIREYNSYRKVNGIGPLGAGFRLYMWKGAGVLPQAALTATVSLPVGNSNMVSNYTDTELRLGFTNTITPDLSLTYTLGYGWVEEGTETKYAFKVSGDLSYRVAVYAEVFGTNAEGSRAAHQADAGVLFIVRQNMQLDVAAGIGLSRAAPDLFITTGYSVRLPR